MGAGRVTVNHVHPELSASPDPPAASSDPGHRVEVTERGSFAFATCSCGWFASARRSRDRARRDAAEHQATPD